MARDLYESILRTKRVYRGRVVGLRRDRVRLPSGRVTIREVVEHPGAVAILPLLPDSRVVLVRQYRHAVGRTLLEVPAGTLRKGERPDKCARRELLEETGYRVGRLTKLLRCYLSPGYSCEEMHIYLAKELRKAGQRQDRDEDIKVVELGLNRAVSLIQEGEIEDAKSIASLLYLLRHTAEKRGV